MIAALLAWAMPANAQLVPGITQITVPRPNANPLANDGPIEVLALPRPEYDALGFQTPQGLLYSSLTANSLYDDNVFSTQSNRVHDIVIQLRPTFTFESRHDMLSYVVSGYGDLEHYVGHESLSNFNAGASLGVIQEIGYDWELESQTGIKYDHQSPASFALPVPNAVISSLPAYTILSEQASLTRRVNRLSLSIGAGYQRETYENVVVNGTVVNEAALNVNAFSLTPRLDYAVTPLTHVFTEGEVMRRIYDDGVLNSNTYTLVVGSDFEFRRLTRGTIFVGLRRRQYDSPLVGSRAAPTFGFNLEWFPTRLLTFTLTGRQDFGDTPIGTPNGGSAVVDIKTARLEGDYEILRQLIGTAVIGLENDTYSQTNRVDTTVNVGLSLTYMINRNLRIVGQYRFTDRHSSAAGFSYVDNAIGAALRVQY